MEKIDETIRSIYINQPCNQLCNTITYHILVTSYKSNTIWAVVDNCIPFLIFCICVMHVLLFALCYNYILSKNSLAVHLAFKKLTFTSLLGPRGPGVPKVSSCACAYFVVASLSSLKMHCIDEDISIESNCFVSLTLGQSEKSTIRPTAAQGA